MWMIFWGLLLFVFFDFRINGIVFTPDFVGFFLVWLGIIRCRGIQTFARYHWTALVACVFSGGEYVFHRSLSIPAIWGTGVVSPWYAQCFRRWLPM